MLACVRAFVRVCCVRVCMKVFKLPESNVIKTYLVEHNT